MPIWNTISSDNECIWRVTPEDGHSRIGRATSPAQALVLKGRCRTGSDTGGDAAPDELVASVIPSVAQQRMPRSISAAG
ncbi:MAG: hypothetical protein Q4P24_08770 [Rhodobacterales bacterium]|nr:hypothetical protein [Rhodobacterales bacterium]